MSKKLHIVSRSKNSDFVVGDILAEQLRKVFVSRKKRYEAVKLSAAERLSGARVKGSSMHFRDTKVLLRYDAVDKTHRSRKRKDFSLLRVQKKQLALYRTMILERVAHRFSTTEAAEEWFNFGTVPGFDKTPSLLVRAGLGAQVIEVVNAIEAGVYA